MKNIHLIPTEHNSKIGSHRSKRLYFHQNVFTESNFEENFYLYVTSDTKIEEENLTKEIWVIDIQNGNIGKLTCKNRFFKGSSKLIEIEWKNKQNIWNYNHIREIVLTTDQDLIKDGIQSIDDEFLEWFVKNPSCEEVDVKYNYVCSNCNEDKNNPKYENCHGNYRTHKIFKIIIPKEEPKVINGGDEIVFPSSTTITFKSKQEKCIYCENKGYIENHTGSSKIDCLQCNIIKEKPKTNLEKLPFPELVKEFEEYYKNVPLVEEKEEEPNFYEKLVEYFKNTPREKVLEDWNKTAECDNIGPTVEEFLGNTEETLEQAAIRLYPDNIIKLGNETSYNAALLKRKDFIDGGNWVKERMYSDEDMTNYTIYVLNNNVITPKQWFNKFKKK